jgi:hypothetical protein
VQRAYGNEALNRSNVFRLYSRFREGRDLVEDDERSGRPKSTRTEVKIVAVADLVKNDHWITSRMIAESLNNPKTLVRPAAFCCRDFFLLHDNAPAHKAASVCQFLTAKKNYNLLSPPYSPELSPPEYFMFAKLKSEVKITPLCGCCWDPRIRNWWIKEGPKKETYSSFSETVWRRKSLYIYYWSLFWINNYVYFSCVFDFF